MTPNGSIFFSIWRKTIYTIFAFNCGHNVKYCTSKDISRSLCQTDLCHSAVVIEENVTQPRKRVGLQDGRDFEAVWFGNVGRRLRCR